jgi:L-aspartate oxidase
LWAAGEAACTGVHGANRLASNSLLEGLVFGARAAAAMQRPAGPGEMRVAPAWAPVSGSSSARVPAAADVQDLMWRHVGLSRDAQGLVPAVAQLGAWLAAVRARQPQPHALPCPVASLVVVGLLIARAALRRTESRGGHFRADFPRRDDLHWSRHASDRLAI